jgi:hypothetical protein
MHIEGRGDAQGRGGCPCILCIPPGYAPACKYDRQPPSPGSPDDVVCRKSLSSVSQITHTQKLAHPLPLTSIFPATPTPFPR